jgi:ATP-binding cassette subfamily B protein
MVGEQDGRSWLPGRRQLPDRLRLLRLFRHVGPLRTTVFCVLHLVVAVAPTLAALVAGRLVTVVAGADPLRWAGAAAGLGALLLVDQVAYALREAVRPVLALRIDGWHRHTVRRLAVGRFEIGHLEQPDFQEDAVRASDSGAVLGRARSPGTAAVGVVAVLARMVSAAVAAALLATFSIALAAALLAVSLAVRSVLRRQWIQVAAVHDAGVAQQHRVYYWGELSVAGAPYEVRLFGLAGWLSGRFRAASAAAYGPAWRAQWRVLRRHWWSVGLVVGAAGAGLALPAVAALHGRIGAGQLVTYVLAGAAILAIGSLGQEAFDIEYGLGAVHAADRLVARYGSASVRPRAAERTAPVADAAPLVRFEHVTFRYPNADRPVLEDFSLTLRPREVLALVGLNGAGKTTIVKLLAGLHPPTGGRITVDGVPLADLDPAEWRRRVAVVFQDFVRYPASLADNVGLAAPERLADRAGIAAALDRAGGADLLATLQDGPETLLWREGRGGVDLSGGQWQCVALARALFAVGAGRRLVVLDEPTAHLDLRAEAAFHERIVGAVRAATCLLISHRFATVRLADRIALVWRGRVAEEGTHDTLVAGGGEYARLFDLQAAAFAGGVR